MEIEQKIEFLTSEVTKLKEGFKRGSNISEDTRKAIIHDVSNLEKESRNRRWVLTISILAVFISLISYIGFISIKQTISDSFIKSNLKDDLLIYIREERAILKNDAKSVKGMLKEANKNNVKLMKKYDDLSKVLNQKNEELHNLARIITKATAKNIDFSELIDKNTEAKLESLSSFNFIKSLGVSEFSVMKALSIFVASFEPTNLAFDNLSESIKKIQLRYELTPDGELGPCTALVIGSLYKSAFPVEAETNIKNSIFLDHSWLANAFQACSYNDRTNIERYLAYPDLPLHKELNDFVDALKLDRGILKNSLKSQKVDRAGYKALDYIGYFPEN